MIPDRPEVDPLVAAAVAPTVEFQCSPVLPADLEQFVRDVARTTWTVFGQLFADRGLELPALRVIVTEDVMATAAREGAALGMSPDRRSGTERLGGVVVGKALVDEAHEHAVILLSAQIASEPDQMSRYWFAESLAHECGHLVYGAVRTRRSAIRMLSRCPGRSPGASR